MKSAVVFSARQLLGYEFCVQLLEKGYTVFAEDFMEWQNEDHEEKWLFIGRNANLQYNQLDDLLSAKQNKYIDYVFIPLPDFYSRDFPQIQKQFIDLLKNITKDEAISQSNFIIIQPSAIHYRNSYFYNEIEKVKSEIHERGTMVMEYYVPVDEQDTFLLFTSKLNEKWSTLDLTSSIANEIICHVENSIYTKK
ncbi:hypothetical protein [Lederbergia citri]|uniref:Uncharacterized protein n=1 Tax=Lederbergia citri TaxID=2833580 RepID=A0A942T9G4_9BACI|nr:hypothetical protein [Lederbergia citri]MBS4193643.1 hypothetical protein [Lederbergia citri]